MIYRKYVSILCCDLIGLTLPGDTILADNAFIVITFGDTDDIENFAKDCVANLWLLAMFHSMSKAIFSGSDIAISAGPLFECMRPIKKAVEVVIADFTISNPFKALWSQYLFVNTNNSKCYLQQHLSFGAFQAWAFENMMEIDT